jgi:hypothetical protein
MQILAHVRQVFYVSVEHCHQVNSKIRVKGTTFAHLVAQKQHLVHLARLRIRQELATSRIVTEIMSGYRRMEGEWFQ